MEIEYKAPDSPIQYYVQNPDWDMRPPLMYTNGSLHNSVCNTPQPSPGMMPLGVIREEQARPVAGKYAALQAEIQRLQGIINENEERNREKHEMLELKIKEVEAKQKSSHDIFEIFKIALNKNKIPR